jgi:hypothetical protein
MGFVRTVRPTREKAANAPTHLGLNLLVKLVGGIFGPPQNMALGGSGPPPI